MIREAIINELERRGVKPAQLVKDLALNKGHLSTFLKSGTSLSLDKVESILDYLSLEIKPKEEA